MGIFGTAKDVLKAIPGVADEFAHGYAAANKGIGFRGANAFAQGSILGAAGTVAGAVGGGIYGAFSDKTSVLGGAFKGAMWGGGIGSIAGIAHGGFGGSLTKPFRKIDSVHNKWSGFKEEGKAYWGARKAANEIFNNAW